MFNLDRLEEPERGQYYSTEIMHMAKWGFMYKTLQRNDLYLWRTGQAQEVCEKKNTQIYKQVPMYITLFHF